MMFISDDVLSSFNLTSETNSLLNMGQGSIYILE